MSLSVASRILVAVLVAASAAAVQAQVTVTDAWVRGTVPQQMGTGMFARITSATAARLVAASSPVAGVVEIHEMAMEGDVMRMRAVTALPLPAGQAVELKPGGYHVMLMGLKQPLKAGETVPVTLTIENAGGQRQTVEVQAAVRTPAGKDTAPMMHSHGHKH